MQPQRPARRASGFTLLEMIIALVVVLVGLLGIFGLLNSTILMNRHTVETSKAAHFAQKRLETIRNTPFGAIASTGSVTDATLRSDDQAAGDELAALNLMGVAAWSRVVSGINTYESGDGLKRVTITVSWGSPSDARQVQLVTYVSRAGLNNPARTIESSF